MCINTRKRTLFTATILRMDPKPSTDTATLRTRRHAFRDLEVREPMEDASLIHTEHSEIFRLDLVHIALVSDGQGAAFEIVWAVGMVFTWRTSGARVVARADVPAF